MTHMLALSLRGQSPEGSLYHINGQCRVERFVLSTPETRAICNDPFVHGLAYTSSLSQAMSTMATLFKKASVSLGEENNAVVLHILRGGLNFGLREALGRAYGWNRHASAYISSQRAHDNEKGWHITENRYQKVFIPKNADIIFGDVVATGVSLEHALLKIVDIAVEQKSSIRSLTFVTIGGERAEVILESIDALCRERFADYTGARVVYIEGRFDVARDNDPRMQIALGGTDLVRRDSLLTPEFVDSQTEQPSYAIERCTIYDAGSRAFQLPEYLEDVHHYWSQVKKLAEDGMTYVAYLRERFPEDSRLQDNAWCSAHDTTDTLLSVAEHQLSRAK